MLSYVYFSFRRLFDSTCVDYYKSIFFKSLFSIIRLYFWSMLWVSLMLKHESGSVVKFKSKGKFPRLSRCTGWSGSVIRCSDFLIPFYFDIVDLLTEIFPIFELVLWFSEIWQPINALLVALKRFDKFCCFFNNSYAIINCFDFSCPPLYY